MTAQTQPVARLEGHWLFAARVIWVAVALLTVGVLAYASFIDHTFFATLENWTAETYGAALAQLGLSANGLNLYHFLSATVIRTVYIAIAAVIFWWKADDRMAFLLSISLLAFSVTAVWVGPIATAHPLLARPLDLLQVVGQTGLVLIFFIFPDGRFVPRWARWPTIVTLATLILPRYNLWFRELAATNPIFWVSILWMFASLPLQIYRYRRVSNPMQRQQTKWAVVGFAGFVLLAGGAWVVSYAIVPSLFPSLQQQSAASLLHIIVRDQVQIIGYLALPVCLAIAILRCRLYDIDIIIRKTLQYSVVTTFLALIYFSSVLLLQRLFSSAVRMYSSSTGQQSPVALVLSTLLIAASDVPIALRPRSIAASRTASTAASTAKSTTPSRCWRSLPAPPATRPTWTRCWLSWSA